MPTHQPLNVLWLIKGLGPGGSERLLVAAAGAHDTDRFALSCAFVVAGKDHLVHDLERLGVSCTCLAPSGQRLWPWRLRLLLRDNRFDVVHIHSPLPGAVARLLIRSLPGSRRPKIVTTEHNAQGTYAWPVRWLNSLTNRWDDASIAVSDEARTSLNRRARQRTNVLVHGIDVASVAAQGVARERVRRELGLLDGELVIGTVANFRRQKDFPNLLNAVAILRNRGVAFRLVVVGQGPLEAEIRSLATHLKLDNIVTFTGFRADATRVMSAFDVFVLSSKWEGLPVALMEALALGLAVVATSVGGVAQVMTHQQDALLVPAKNAPALAKALEQALEDAVLRRRLAREGHTLAQRFDIRRAVSELEATYLGLVPQREVRASTDVLTLSVPPGSPKRRRQSSGMHIRLATPADRDGMIAALRKPLQWGDDPRNAALFAWKHDENPFGASPIWLALDGTRIVAVRTFMQWRFQRGSDLLKVARAVDTATDADYQGRGLFTELTTVGIAELTAQGYDFIFNTPNDQSRPGYLKLGWRDVGALPVAVRPRARRLQQTLRSRVPAQRWSAACDVGISVEQWLETSGLYAKPSVPGADVRALVTPIDTAFIRWRYAHPLLAYRVVENDDCALIVRARIRGQAQELVVASVFGPAAAADQLMVSTLQRTDCAHALRLGPPRPRKGIVPMPGGPRLTWRGLNTLGMPPLSNWQLSLGDIELL